MQPNNGPTNAAAPLKKFRIKLSSIKSSSQSQDIKNVPSASIKSEPTTAAGTFETEIKSESTLESYNDKPILIHDALPTTAPLQKIEQSQSATTQFASLFSRDDSLAADNLPDGDTIVNNNHEQHPIQAVESASSSMLAHGDRQASSSKFKLKIKKPVGATTTPTRIKNIIDNSFHYDLPVGSACITSGISFDKSFFDAIYPGKKTSVQMDTCDLNTKTMFFLENFYQKQRTKLIENVKRAEQESAMAVDTQNEQRRNKISFTIKRDNLPATPSPFNIAPIPPAFEHDVDMDEELCFSDRGDEVHPEEQNTNMEVGLKPTSKDGVGGRWEPLPQGSLDLSQLFIKPPPEGISCSVFNTSAPSCVTMLQSFSKRKRIAKAVISQGYKLIVATTLLPETQPNPVYIDGLMKLSFSTRDGTHLFYDVSSKMTKSILIENSLFSIAGYYRFITTTISIINLSSIPMNVKLDIEMSNDIIEAKEPMKFKIGIKTVQIDDKFKILPPSGYAGLLLESFHRAIKLEKNRQAPDQSVHITNLLEILWDYFKSDNISVLREVDSLVKTRFEVGKLPCYIIELFTPKRCEPIE